MLIHLQWVLGILLSLLAAEIAVDIVRETDLNNFIQLSYTPLLTVGCRRRYPSASSSRYTSTLIQIYYK